MEEIESVLEIYSYSARDLILKRNEFVSKYHSLNDCPEKNLIDSIIELIDVELYKSGIEVDEFGREEINIKLLPHQGLGS